MLHVFLKHLVSDTHVVFQMARGVKRLNYKSLVISRGYAPFNLCCISFQLFTETPSWWNHNLCLTFRGASSSSLSNTVARSLQNLWEVNFSGSRKGPTKRPRLYQPKIYQCPIKCNNMQPIFIVLHYHSTCFGCRPHPSSGVYKTVVTVTGTSHMIVHLPHSNVANWSRWSEVAARSYDLYQWLELQFYVLLMMGVDDTQNM